MAKFLNNIDEINQLITIFPDEISNQLRTIAQPDQLLEVVMDLGRVPMARYVHGEFELSQKEISFQEIQDTIAKVGAFDLDNRAGMENTLHRISALRNRRGDIIGLTCRAGRAVFGTTDIIRDYIESGKSVLILGKPGIGKTTMLREAARILAENKRVVIVDTSNEIGGDGNIPHAAIGKSRRMQVPQPSLQHEVMIEAVENHNPEVIVIDEIGRELEALAARTIAERGVQLIGTAHGRTLGNLLMNPTLSDLIGGIESVTLSDEEAKRRGTQKTVLERRSPPTFDVLVEIQERDCVIVYADVSAAVDGLVRGIEVYPELRRRNQKNGEISYEKAPAPVLEGFGFAAPANNNSSSFDPFSRQRSNIISITGKSGKTRKGGTEGNSPEPAKKPDNGNANVQDGLQNQILAGEPIRVFPYGIARNRLYQAAKRLQVTVSVSNTVEDADIMMTLRPYYRERQQIIIEAENRNIPIYVLRSNTVNQMEYSLSNLFNVPVVTQATDWDDVEEETADAIRTILSNDAAWVDLSPADSSIRRIQHEMADRANLASQSYGKEPKRRLRIYRNQ